MYPAAAERLADIQPAHPHRYDEACYINHSVLYKAWHANLQNGDVERVKKNKHTHTMHLQSRSSILKKNCCKNVGRIYLYSKSRLWSLVVIGYLVLVNTSNYFIQKKISELLLGWNQKLGFYV